MLIQGVLFQ